MTKKIKTKQNIEQRKNKAAKERSGLQYIDGKSDVDEQKADLETLLNPAGVYNPFKTSCESELEAKITDMSMPELQSLAVEVGVFPSGNRTTLKNKLKKEFKNRVFLGKGKVLQTTKSIANPKVMSAEQKKLFNID